MKNLLVLTIFSMVLFSCSKNEPSVFEENYITYPSPNLTGFDDLEIGDEFNYVHFELESYGDPENGNYSFTKDTVNLEVCGFRDGKFVVSERITDGSDIHLEENNYIGLSDSIFTYYMFIRNDSLITEQMDDKFFYSHLFLRKPINLNLLPFGDNEVEMNGWKTTEPYHESITESYVTNALISDNMYPQLNVYTYNISMILDGPGYKFFYNRDQGMIRTATYSWWTSTGDGWELIVE